jgi:hypothetical protein
VYASTNRQQRELAEVCLDQASPLIGQSLVAAESYSEVGGSIVGFRVRRSDRDMTHLENIQEDGAATDGLTKFVSKKRLRLSGGGFAPALISRRSISFDIEDSGAVVVKSDRPLKHGDQLIVDAPAGFCKNNGSHTAKFLSIRKLGGHAAKKSEKDTFIAYLSGAILVVMLGFVAFNIFPLFPCALGGIFVLVITGCGTVDGAKKAVPLKVVFTIVGAFGIGNAIGQHGVSDMLGDALVVVFSPLGKIGLLYAVAFATAGLGIIFHGTAVVALMFPMCVTIAQTSQIPLHRMIAVLCYSVACQMLSPVSYNTNLMAFAACPEYAFNDFPKLGGPLVIIIFLVAIPLSQVWFV